MNLNIIKIATLAVITLAGAQSCRKGCTDPKAENFDAGAKKEDNSCTYKAADVHDASHIMIKMNHKYDGNTVLPGDFNDIKYTNDKGTNHSITKIQYLVSDFVIYKADGDSIVVEGYNFVDFDNTGSFAYSFPEDVHVPYGDYTGVGFTWGFDQADNTTGAYPDLNAASWSWPAMIGGGYHFMKLEGRFIDVNTDTTAFQFHNGTASNGGVHEANHFYVKMNKTFTLTKDASINIDMNIEEWFKNPNQWDLDAMHASLMPNYNAQIMMNQNGSSVFSLGTIDQ